MTSGIALRRSPLAIAALLSLFLIPILFASLHAQRPTPLSDPLETERVQGVVRAFAELASKQRLGEEEIARFAVDELEEKLLAMPFDVASFNGSGKLRLGAPFAIREAGDIVMVAAADLIDTLPRIGRVERDWIFYVRRIDSLEWRISAIRTQDDLDRGVATIRHIDTTTAFPESLKPEIVRETETLLMSNAKLREHFRQHAGEFARLLKHFTRGDSLRILSRTGDKPNQINMIAIDWGMASHDIPQHVRDEYLASASADQRAEFSALLRHAERLRRAADDSLRSIAKRQKLNLTRIDSAIASMKRLRVSFVNSRLPWEGAVQFTLGGELGNAAGYLFTPKGELPYISPFEYFYLEELGEGWWIFRAT